MFDIVTNNLNYLSYIDNKDESVNECIVKI